MERILRLIWEISLAIKNGQGISPFWNPQLTYKSMAFYVLMQLTVLLYFLVQCGTKKDRDPQSPSNPNEENVEDPEVEEVQPNRITSDHNVTHNELAIDPAKIGVSSKKTRKSDYQELNRKSKVAELNLDHSRGTPFGIVDKKAGKAVKRVLEKFRQVWKTQVNDELQDLHKAKWKETKKFDDFSICNKLQKEFVFDREDVLHHKYPDKYFYTRAKASCSTYPSTLLHDVITKQSVFAIYPVEHFVENIHTSDCYGKENGDSTPVVEDNDKFKGLDHLFRFMFTEKITVLISNQFLPLEKDKPFKFCLNGQEFEVETSALSNNKYNVFARLFKIKAKVKGNVNDMKEDETPTKVESKKSAASQKHSKVQTKSKKVKAPGSTQELTEVSMQTQSVKSTKPPHQPSKKLPTPTPSTTPSKTPSTNPSKTPTPTYSQTPTTKSVNSTKSLKEVSCKEQSTMGDPSTKPNKDGKRARTKAGKDKESRKEGEPKKTRGKSNNEKESKTEGTGKRKKDSKTARESKTAKEVESIHYKPGFRTKTVKLPAKCTLKGHEGKLMKVLEGADNFEHSFVYYPIDMTDKKAYEDLIRVLMASVDKNVAVSGNTRNMIIILIFLAARLHKDPGKTNLTQVLNDTLIRFIACPPKAEDLKYFYRALEKFSTMAKRFESVKEESSSYQY